MLFRWVTTLGARRATRDSNSPACHTALDGLSFIPRSRAECKGVFTKLMPETGTNGGCDVTSVTDLLACGRQIMDALQAKRTRINSRAGSPQLRQNSRAAAKYCSPRRKPWVGARGTPAPEGRKKMSHTSGNILLHLIFSTHQELFASCSREFGQRNRLLKSLAW